MIDKCSRRARLPWILLLVLTPLLVGAGATAWWVWLRKPPPEQKTGNPDPPRPRQTVEVPAVRFTDHTVKAGIRFHHVSGSQGKKLLPETMGSGVAFLDYDADGKPDLLFVNSCYWPGYENGQRPTQALYRNKGDGTFEDVTTAAGLDVTFYGMGVCCGDFDNDGWIDVFLTGVGTNKLFRNVPAGKTRKFEDFTVKAGVVGPGGWPTGGDFLKSSQPINFSSSATFLDYDGDARLDLFVCNYLTWSPEYDLSQPFVLAGRDERAFGPPRNFKGTQCFLYRNRGDGTFEDVSAPAGVQVFNPNAVGAENRDVAKSLGVVVSDVDRDGWPDICVANDTVRNFFFHNQPDGKGGRRLVEKGIPTGMAWVEGVERGAMGIDCGEYRPGRCGFIIANFANEPNTLVRLDDPKNILFQDVATAEGVAGPSRPLLKFGVFFFDYDLDGRQDFLTCNGHLEPGISRVQPGQTYEQPAQLFWNTGQKKGFEPVPPERAGPDLFRPLVGRGSAYADIDGDGDLDVVLTGNGGPALLLRNDGGTGHHWIRLLLQGDGVRSNTSAIGARVTLEAGGVVQHREVAGARGYLSQSELAVTFGLGKTDKVDRITIHWPGKAGSKQELTEQQRTVDKLHVIKQSGAN